MAKAAAGGGGMGMAVAADEASLRTEFEKVRAFAERMCGDHDGPHRSGGRGVGMVLKPAARQKGRDTAHDDCKA